MLFTDPKRSLEIIDGYLQSFKYFTKFVNLFSSISCFNIFLRKNTPYISEFKKKLEIFSYFASVFPLRKLYKRKIHFFAIDRQSSRRKSYANFIANSQK